MARTDDEAISEAREFHPWLSDEWEASVRRELLTRRSARTRASLERMILPVIAMRGTGGFS